MNNIGAFTIIRVKDSILLIQKNYDSLQWGLPGGTVNKGEKLIDAAKRELFEEANLSIQELQYAGVFYSVENYSLAFCFKAELEFIPEVMANNLDTKKAQFFNQSQLPKHTSARTKKQLDQILNKVDAVNLIEYP